MSREVIRPDQFCKAKPTTEVEEYKLTNEEIKALDKMFGESVEIHKRSSMITGTVVSKTDDGVFLDINFKSEGFVSSDEFNEHELKDLKVGSEIDVFLEELESVDGSVVLSYQKAKTVKAWKRIMKLYDEGESLEGVVLNKVKGGLSVDIGVPAFLPGSQIDTQHVSDFDQYVGKTVRAYILKVNAKRGNVIISRRKYLNEQRSELRQKILDSVVVDQTVTGTVKNITNYGAFIDIGGIDGLLHITDMTWGRIGHPSEVLNIGDQVAVKVLSFDKERERVSLGMKQLEENPWESLVAKLEPGSEVEGKVSSIMDYGIFVAIESGLEGLVHISEVSWGDRVVDLRENFKAGDPVKVKVISINKETKRMSLSIKQLQPNPWDVVISQFSVGQKVKGKITNITDFGLFVQLVPGVDGLVHVSDISWTEHIKNLSNIYEKGDEIEAVVISIDKDKKKISLGVKQLIENPWETFEKKYSVGEISEGEIVKITDLGAFVKVPEGIEGFLHFSEVPNLKGEKLKNFLKVGQKSQFRIVKISREDHKLGLSMKLEAPAVSDSDSKSKEVTRKAAKPSPKAASSARPKSQLQLELEKHAARSASEKKKPAEKKVAEDLSEKKLEKNLTEEPAKKSTVKSAEKPAQKTTEKSTEKSEQEPIEKPVEKPAQKAAEKSAQKPAEKSVEEEIKKEN